MATKAELELKTALLGTGMVQPIQSKSRGGHIEVLCRQIPGQDKTWLAAVAGLLACESEELQVHVCRRYVLKAGKMVFGWHVQLDAKTAKALHVGVDAVVVELANHQPELTAPPEVATRIPAVASPEPPPAPKYKSEYKTDAQVMQELGLSGRADDGRLGRRVNPLPVDDLRAAANARSGDRLTDPRLKLVEHRQGADGRSEYVMEFPLPHQSKEMNVPTHEGGAGARYMNKGTEATMAKLRTASGKVG
jgi:hypothetical protein